MTGIIGISLSTSAAAVPYLQTTALNAVKKAVIARGGVTMTVNSALRTLPQQLSSCFVEKKTQPSPLLAIKYFMGSVLKMKY